MELKASSRQLAGGAHGDFHVVGLPASASLRGLREPPGAFTTGSDTPRARASRKGSWGGGGHRKSLPDDALFSREKSSRGGGGGSKAGRHLRSR